MATSRNNASARQATSRRARPSGCGAVLPSLDVQKSTPALRRLAPQPEDARRNDTNLRDTTLDTTVMKPIFAVFWNICLLRRGPEFVPTHPLFVGGIVTADVLLSFFVAAQYRSNTSLMQIATSTVVTMATLAAATWLALNVRGVIGRYPATITAMFGCDLFFTLLVALLVPLSGGADSPVSVGMAALIGIWSIAVNGFILHRAMNIAVFAGILFAFGMAVLAFALASSAAGP